MSIRLVGDIYEMARNGNATLGSWRAGRIAVAPIRTGRHATQSVHMGHRLTDLVEVDIGKLAPAFLEDALCEMSKPVANAIRRASRSGRFFAVAPAGTKFGASVGRFGGGYGFAAGIVLGGIAGIGTYVFSGNRERSQRERITLSPPSPPNRLC